MYTLILLTLAVLPPLFFLSYLLKADRTEPEPLQMVLYAMALGILSTLPASLLEAALGLLPIFGQEGLIGAAITSFVQVAPVEEGCKLAVVLLFVWNNRNFNEENDGIVYVTASSIGFALLENVMYVLDGGIATSLGRAFTSIPLHTFCGVLMGAYVGRARFAADRREATRLVVRGFLIAWAIHGLYDTFALSHAQYTGVLLLILVASLFVVGRRALKRGHELSVARWSNPGTATQIQIDTVEQQVARALAKYGEDKIGRDEDGRYFLKPERQTWKRVSAIALFVISIGVWVAIGCFVSLYAIEDVALINSIVSFTIVMTVVPILLGALLLSSYKRRLAANHYF
jgi:RsiW-degrading membrane proteinase PrsW (M82 family)